MKVGQLRTNLFHFNPTLLPDAFQFQASERYRTAWRLLNDIWNRNNRYNMPTNLLSEMLSILSKGPVWVNTNPDRNKSLPAIATLKPISIELVNRALHIWALDVLHRSSSSEPSVPDNLHVFPSTILRAEDIIAKNGGSSTLAYTIVPWLVSSAMTPTPMSSTVPLSLHLTSDGDLLAWDNPIVSESGQRRAMALHGIRPQLVLLRNAELPFIAIRVHLSHILTEWRHKTRHVLLQTNDTIAKLAIFTKRNVDGSYETDYSNATSRLLSHMGIDPFPHLGTSELSPRGNVRPIHAHIPSSPLIASGTGPLFLDQACWHLMESLPGTAPVLANKAISMLRKSVNTGADVSVGTQSVLVVSAHSRTSVRLENAYKILADEKHLFKGNQLPIVELRHISPSNAEQALCEPGIGMMSLEEWFQHEVKPHIHDSEGTAIIETSLSVAQAKAEHDPKFRLRELFAKQGVTTQFIFDAEPSDPDYAASACLIEAIRQSGVLPGALPRVKSMPENTTIVSIYVDRIKTKGPALLLPVITRIGLYGGNTEIFWFDHDSKTTRWFDYRTGIARIHATEHLFTRDDVQNLVMQAFLAPTPIADMPLLVYLHSGLRAVYDGLKDSGGNNLPEIANNSAWLVRIRADDDTAQMSGDNIKHPLEAAFIGTKIGLYRVEDRSDLYYFVSPSNQYGRVISQRKSTRFDILDRSLRDPWQQLGVTEIAVISSASFASELDIAHQTALLCRNAPLWEGNLRLPSPMHMAKQVAEDHPLIEINRRVHGI